MGMLRVKVGGQWVDLAGGSDEVAIGPDDPIGIAPTTELWYDTDAAAAMTNDMRWNTAWGQVAYAQILASVSGISALADIPGLSVTFTAVAGRNYLIEGYGLVFQATSAAIAELRITDAANAQYQTSAFSQPASGYAQNYVSRVVSGLTAGPQTFKLRAVTTAGTITIQVGASSPAFIKVTDIGPTAGVAPTIDPSIGLRCGRAAVQSIPNNAVTEFTFDTEYSDTHGFFTPPSTTITIPSGQAGAYLIGGQISAAANTGTTCYADMVINGSVLQRSIAAGNTSPPFPLFFYNMAVGTTIKVQVAHTAGVAVNFTCFLMMIKLGVL